MGTLITALVLLVIVIWVLASCIKIVPQAQAYVVSVWELIMEQVCWTSF